MNGNKSSSHNRLAAMDPNDQSNLSLLKQWSSFSPMMISMVMIPLFSTFITTANIAINNSDMKSSLWAGLVASGALSLDVIADEIRSKENFFKGNWEEKKLSLLVLLPNCLLCGMGSIPDKLYTIIVAYQLLFFSQHILLQAIGRDSSLRSEKKILRICLPILNTAVIVAWYIRWVLINNIAVALVAAGSMFIVLSTALTRIIVLKREFYLSTSISVSCENVDVPSTSITFSKNNELRLVSCCYYLLYMFSVSLVWILWLVPTSNKFTHDFTRLAYLVEFLLLLVTKFHERVDKDTLKLVSMAMNMNRLFVRFISHELRSHVGHLSMGLDQLTDVVPAGADTTVRMIEELQDSCDSSLQILEDVVVFDGLNYQDQNGDCISIVRMKKIISMGIKEIEPVVGM